ncbi:MAG: hypothetical protein ACOC8I_04520, partial [Desulfosalsimonas sp.]
MKIKVLSSAIKDLYEGRKFYEKQREGLGEYFFDSLFSDVDSLTLYAGPLCQDSCRSHYFFSVVDFFVLPDFDFFAAAAFCFAFLS